MDFRIITYGTVAPNFSMQKGRNTNIKFEVTGVKDHVYGSIYGPV